MGLRVGLLFFRWKILAIFLVLCNLYYGLMVEKLCLYMSLMSPHVPHSIGQDLLANKEEKVLVSGNRGTRQSLIPPDSSSLEG